MDEQFLKAMHPVTAVLHWKILSILKQYDIKGGPTIVFLDVQGTERMDLRLLDLITTEQFLLHMNSAKNPVP